MDTAATKRTGRTRPRRDATINLRLSEKVKTLIDTAAAALGKTRTEFVIDSARKHATDVLLDRRLFELEDEQWAAFTAALDNPPLPNERLRKLMARTPPWERLAR